MNVFRTDLVWLMLALFVPLVVHIGLYVPSEPFFNNDENRHVMTGVFFRDFYLSGQYPDAKEYAVRYYLQYPAIGLLVWPPLLHMVEGLFMLVLGPSMFAALLTVGCFAILAALYLFRLVQMTHNARTACFTVLLTFFTPLIFPYSHQVMAEIPALAMILMSIFYFERYLKQEQRRDAYRCGFFAALASLTRFDGCLLLLYFGWRLLSLWKITWLKRPAVLGSVFLALLISVPYYLITWLHYGPALVKAVQDTPVLFQEATTFLGIKNFLYYPMYVPEQIGWIATILSVIGILGAWISPNRSAYGPYFGILLAVYGLFTPMSELDSRHSIYWIPAFALFAVEGTYQLFSWVMGCRLCGTSTVLLMIGLTAYQTCSRPRYFVSGYQQAAHYVLEQNQATRFCLIDGFLNGDFIYQVRIQDPQQRLWILRGDKLFYSVFSDPSGGYQQHVNEEKEVIARIELYDPELIIVEEPQIYFELTGATLLRQTLKNHPERFERLTEFPIHSNHFRFQNLKLVVYRNKLRNPNPSDKIELNMLNLKGKLGGQIR